MKLFTYLLSKLQTNLLAFLLLSICCFSLSNLKAQCPTGETEVTISFSNEVNSADELATLQWNYIIGGLVSENGPYSITDTLALCVPHGEFLITVCGSDYNVWTNTSREIKITEDGSVNGCDGQNGCLTDFEIVTNSFNYSGFDVVQPCEDQLDEPVLSVTIGCENSTAITRGCTNSDAPNYNPCATDDDGKCEITSANNDCSNAIPLAVSPDIFETESISVNNVFNTTSGLLPSCFNSYTNHSSTDVFFQIEVPASGNIEIDASESVGIALYDTCGGIELHCDQTSGSSQFYKIYGLTPGDQLILQVWQYYNPSFFRVWAYELPSTLQNEVCSNPTQLCGTPVFENNEGALTETDEPEFSCFNDDLTKSLWYSFVADNSGQPISIYISDYECVNGFDNYPYSGGLRTGILSGTCNALIEEACFESTEFGNDIQILTLENPTPGETYYVYTALWYYGFYCKYDITTSTGIETCCGPEINMTAICESPNANEFYVELEVIDLGDNPTIYTINNDDLQLIIGAGIRQIGPFPTGIATITLSGDYCEIVYKIDGTCTEEPFYDCNNPQPLEVEPFQQCYGMDVESRNQASDLQPSCFGGYFMYGPELVADYFFSFTVPPSGNFEINGFGNPNFHYAIYDDCNNTELTCIFYDSIEPFYDYTPGQELILQIFQLEPEAFQICIEEVPDTPTNDACEDAIPLCEGSVTGNTLLSSTNENDPGTSCGSFNGNSIWYTFETDDSGADIGLYIIENCDNGNYEYIGFGDVGFIATIYSGSCEGAFNEETCVYISERFAQANNPYLLTIENPQPTTTYYLLVSELESGGCPFEIVPASGIANCCNADIAINAVCNDGIEDQFYVDIQVNDLGDNPSGYFVNDTLFANITSTGTTTIGPFDNGFKIITLTGLDDETCKIRTGIEQSCVPVLPNSVCSGAIPIDFSELYTCKFNSGKDNYPYNINIDVLTDGMDILPEECFYRYDDLDNPAMFGKDVFYEVTVPAAGGFQIYNTAGSAIASTIYNGCNGEQLLCNWSGDYHYIKDLTPGETVIIQFWKYIEPKIGLFSFCLEERPTAPVNDLCENAIELNCSDPFLGHNISSTASEDDAITSCGDPKNTVWYSFVANASSTKIRINDEDENAQINVAILSGNCGGPFTIEACRTIFSSGVTTANTVVGEQYFIQIGSKFDNQTSFEISIEEGFVSCEDLCKPTVTFTSNCPNEDEPDVYYVDIEVADMGENPSGYIVNGGDFPNITTTGITTVGPFDNGTITITLEGLDVANCILEEKILHYCNCSTLNTTNINRDKLIFAGDTIELAKPDFGLLGYECEFVWVTDVENPVETYIGDDETLILVPDSSVIIYGISTCTNCKQYILIQDITVIEYEACNELAVAASSGSVLFYGNYYDYNFTTELSIELTDTVSCDFLYWVTDISNPEESIISTEQNYTVEVPAGAGNNYFGIVACDNEECVEVVTVYTPIFDGPFFPPYYGGNPTDPGNPGQPGTPGGDPNTGEDDNPNQCDSLTIGTLTSADKYICAGDKPTLELAGTDIPVGKQIYYVYHNNPDFTTAGYSSETFVYALSFDDLLVNEDLLPCASVVYVTAFAADNVSALSQLSLSGDCIEFSNTVELTYLCPVEIEVQQLCNENNGTYNLVVTVTGGLPQVLTNLPYSIYGTVYKGSSLHGETFTIPNLADGSSYSIEILDSEGCYGRATGTVQCDKLPVELLLFEGEAQTNGNLLKWVTATEIDNDYFTIESSTDGINFTKTATIKGGGNQTTISNYSYLDRTELNGTTYYRLSQTDFDGTTAIKAYTEITRGEKQQGFTLLNAQPVPFNEQLQIQISSSLTRHVYISLVDVVGRQIVNQKFNLSNGLNQLFLETEAFSKGLYLLKIESPEMAIYKKILKE